MAKDLDDLLGSIDELPTLRQVAVRLIHIIDDPMSSARDVDQIILQDPALAAKVLKLANSAFVGLPRRVSSLEKAIVILGFNVIKGMALSVSVFDVFAEKRPEDEKLRRSFWIHSIATSALCQEIGVKVPDVDENVAFVLGLLHDIGKMVIDIHAHEEWLEILRICREEKVPFHVAERRVLATDHAEIGGWLTRRWSLQEDLVDGIRGHHREAHWKGSSLGRVLHLANLLAHTVERGRAEGVLHDPEIREVAALLRITDLVPLVRRTEGELERAGVFLSALGGAG